MANQKLNIDIVAKDKSKQALNGVQSNLSKVKSAVFNLQNAFISLGAGLAVRSLVNTGKQIEGLQVRLKFLFGSAQEGAKAFDEMSKFASKVPFSLEEIQSGSGVLSVVSKDAKELAHFMEITGNVAAVTGLDFRTTAEQIQRSMSAGIASADIFREKGVRAMLGFKAGATVSVEETAKAFKRVFGKGGQFGSATDELAKTFEGTLSMIGDSFFNLKRKILDAGFFEELKIQFQALDKFVKENEKTFNEFATTVGKGLASAVRGTASAIGFLKDNFKLIIETIKVLIAFKLIVFFTNLTLAIKGSTLAMLAFNKATKKNLLIGAGAVVATQIQNIIDLIAELTGKEVETNEEAGKMKEIFIESLPPIFEAMTTMQKFKKAVAETVEKVRELTDKRLDELKKKAESIKDIIAKGFVGGIKKMSDAIAEAIVLGKSLEESFRKMAQSLLVKIISHLIEEIALMGIKKILKKEEEKTEANILNTLKSQNTERKRAIFFNALGGGSGGGFPFFAKGGAVSKGQPVIVGEQGAEMFIPNSSGQITQAARGTNSGQTTVNFNINTLDASGFDELLVRNRGTITAIINSAVNERGSKNLI
ncbi:tape measure protein [uncultured Mediterranean phage uvMED]|nr:tape measure protein [uncultured Mediterranean phage uvMED]